MTLPEKYYNLEAHERMLQSIANGEMLMGGEEVYDFRKDEADISKRVKASAPARPKQEEHLSQSAVSGRERQL